MHKITSFEDDMRKFLSQKFWSHGTLLGSMGPGSQQDADERFSKSQILVKWGPYNCSVIVACREQAKKPNLASSLVCPLYFPFQNSMTHNIPKLCIIGVFETVLADEIIFYTRDCLVY